MPAVGRREDGQRHRPLVGDDGTGGRAHGLDPAPAVDTAFLVVPDVDLIGGPIGEIAVAGRLQAVVLDLVHREAPRRDRLRAERLGGPAARHLAEPQEVLLERHLQDQPQGASVRTRGEVELERSPVVRGAALGHGHPRAVIGIRREQVGRRAPPGLPADHVPGGVVDLVRAVRRSDHPGLAVGDLAHQRAADRLLHGQPHGPSRRRQVEHVLGRGQRDPDVAWGIRDLRHPGSAVEVRDDLGGGPPFGRQPVRAPLGEPEPVAPAAAVERDGVARAGGDGGEQGRRDGHDERE